MPSFTLAFKFEFDDGATAEYCCVYIRFWPTESGQPEFTGTIDSFAEQYPERVETILSTLIKK